MLKNMEKNMKLILKSSIEVHRRYLSEIRKSNKYLIDQFNINNYYYRKILTTGNCCVFGSNLDLLEELDSHKFLTKLPDHRHPAHYKEGIVIRKVVEDSALDNLQDSVKTMLKFDVNLGIRLIRKTNDYVEEFGFHSKETNENQVMFFFNHIEDLDQWVKFFKKTNSKLFELLNENSIDLAKLIGDQFYQDRNQEIDLSSGFRRKLLYELGVGSEYDFRHDELELLSLISSKHSIQDIAQITQRNVQDVEESLEIIRQRLSCSSGRDLIRKATELKHLWQGSLYLR